MPITTCYCKTVRALHFKPVNYFQNFNFVSTEEQSWLQVGLERIHQVTNTIRIAIQGGEYDTYREYTFSQRLN